MAIIKVKVKIGDHEPETVKVDNNYHEEEMFYDEFEKAFKQFKNKMHDFRYSPNSPHHKSKMVEIHIEDETIPWPELKTKIRTLIDENLERLKGKEPFVNGDIKRLYEERYASFPKGKTGAISEVLREYVESGSFLQLGEPNRNREYIFA